MAEAAPVVAATLKVTSPNPAASLKVAPSNRQPLISGSSFPSRGAAMRIRSRRALVMGYPACVDLAGFANQLQRGGSLVLAGMGKARPGRGEADAGASGLFTRRPYDFGLLGHPPSELTARDHVVQLLRHVWR